MKVKTYAAVFLVVLGVAAFIYQGVTYATLGRDMAIGSAHTTTRPMRLIPLSLIFGSVALVGGIALLLVDKTDFKSTATP